MFIQAHIIPNTLSLIPRTSPQGEKLQKSRQGLKRVLSAIHTANVEMIVLLSPYGREAGAIEVESARTLRGDLSLHGLPQLACENPGAPEAAKALLHELHCETFIKEVSHLSHLSEDVASFTALHFLQLEGIHLPVLILSYHHPSTKDAYALGEALARVCHDKRCALIAIGNLSTRLETSDHELPQGAGAAFEKEAEAAVREGDFSTFYNLSDLERLSAEPEALPMLITIEAALDDRLSTEIYSHEWPLGFGMMTARLGGE